MENKQYITIITVIFSAIFVVHVLRILMGWEVQIAGLAVPVWASWFGILVAGYLAFTGFKLMKK